METPTTPPPERLCVLIEDAGARTRLASSFDARLKRWVKAALRGYAIRVVGIRTARPRPDAARG